MGNRQAHCLQKADEGRVDVLTLAEISQAIHSGDPEQEFRGCQMIHKLLDPLPPPHSVIKAIAESGILPKCVELLQCPNPETRLEAAWTVSKMAWGNSVVLDPMTLSDNWSDLYHSTQYRLDQAVRTLGRTDVNDYPGRTGFVPRLLTLAVSSESQVPLLRYIAWTLGATSLPWDSPQAVQIMLPALVHLLNMDDTEVIADTCSALTKILRLAFQEILNSGLPFRLIELLSSKESKIIVSCSLDVIQSLMRGTPDQIDVVLGSGPLIQTLGRLTEYIPECMNYRALLAVTTLLENGTVGQANVVINGGLVPVLIKTIENDSDWTYWNKKEATKIVKNLTTTPAHRHHIPYFCQCGVIPAVCSLFKLKHNTMYDDGKLLCTALETLSQILDTAEGDKLLEYRKMIEECGGLDSFDKLQDEHEDSEGVGDDSEIYKLVCSVVNKHFQDNPSADGLKPTKMQKLDI